MKRLESILNSINGKNHIFFQVKLLLLLGIRMHRTLNNRKNPMLKKRRLPNSKDRFKLRERNSPKNGSIRKTRSRTSKQSFSLILKERSTTRTKSKLTKNKSTPRTFKWIQMNYLTSKTLRIMTNLFKQRQMPSMKNLFKEQIKSRSNHQRMRKKSKMVKKREHNFETSNRELFE